MVLCSVRQATLLRRAGKGGSWQYWTAQGLRSCFTLLIPSLACTQMCSPARLEQALVPPAAARAGRAAQQAADPGYIQLIMTGCLAPAQIRAARQASHEVAMRLTCAGRELADAESTSGITGMVLCLLYDRSLTARGSKRACEEPAQCDLDMLPADWVRVTLWQCPGSALANPVSLSDVLP